MARYGRIGQEKRHRGAWRTAAALIGLALLVAAGAAAQVYKWKDAKGTVHYGDTPPPQGAQVLKTPGQAPADPNALPYELARAVRLHPVTLYTTARCDACDQGRGLLRARGVPFTEKTVASVDDQQEQRRQTGKDELPLLLVGSRQVAGFQAAGWNEALDSASYPRQKMLPPGYQSAPPRPAAPAGAGASSTSSPTSTAASTAATAASTAANAPGTPPRAPSRPAADAAAAQAGRAQPRQPTPPPGNTPPGFQF